MGTNPSPVLAAKAEPTTNPRLSMPTTRSGWGLAAEASEAGNPFRL
jgi:hypothetical protein